MADVVAAVLVLVRCFVLFGVVRKIFGVDICAITFGGYKKEGNNITVYP